MKLLVLCAAFFASGLVSAKVHLYESHIVTGHGKAYTLASSPRPLSEISDLDFENIRENIADFKVKVIVGRQSQQLDADSIISDLKLPQNTSVEVFPAYKNISGPTVESSEARKSYQNYNRTENWMFATVMTAYISAATFTVWIFAKDADPQTAATIAALYSAPVFYMTLGLRWFDKIFRKAAEKLKFGPVHFRETGVRMSGNLFHAELYMLWMFLFAQGSALNSMAVQSDVLLNVFTTSVGAAYLDSIRTRYFKSSQSKWFNFTVFALLSPLILADLSGIHFLDFDLLGSTVSLPTLGVVVSAQLAAAQLLQRSKKFRNGVRRFTITQHRSMKKFFRKAKTKCQDLLIGTLGDPSFE